MYTDLIRKAINDLGVDGIEPRHVEAWMRLTHGTLDNCIEDDFRRYVHETVSIERAVPGESEALAVSLGL